MTAEKLADFMLRHVRKLHCTTKKILLGRGQIFISHITKEFDKHLINQLHLLTVYQPRTDGQCETSNKAVKQ